MKKNFKIRLNIKSRLTLQFMLVVAGILVLFTILVYYFTFTTHRDKYRISLLNRAKNTAIIFSINKHADTSLLRNIHQSTFIGQSQQVLVTDTAFHILYKFNTDQGTLDVLKTELQKTPYGFFVVNGKDGVFYHFQYRKKPAVVMVVAVDNARIAYLKELKQILFWSILFSLWFSILLSYFLSRKAFVPVAKIISKVKVINASSLNSRLDEGKGVDELEQLSVTFNNLLSDLEDAFKNQEDFISNASHELRTPLTVMIAETDYFLGKEHPDEDFRQHLKEMLSDLRNLNSIINNLLELAHLNRAHNADFSVIRIDEVVFNAIYLVKQQFPDRRIITHITYPENEELLHVSGNQGLLRIAFKNLIENACKFSANNVEVVFMLGTEGIGIVISDDGIGIPEQEMDSIYQPFKRGSNAKYKPGFGLGLSLVAKIMSLHQVQITLSSKENHGTRFELRFQPVAPV